MKHNASKTRETLVRLLLVAAFAVTLSLTVGRQPFSPAKQAQAKTVSAKEYNLYFHVKAGKTKRIYVTGEDIKKVKSSNKSVLTAKLNKKKTAVVVHTKKKGTAKVIITYKDGTKSNTKYDVEHALTKETKNNKAKLKFNKKRAQKAFDIQNSYRAEVGVADLEWSDELYEFAKYRLETSGYDKHENMTRDAQDYFVDFYVVGELNTTTLSENLARSSGDAKRICEAWKNSPGHYENLLKEKWQCGAMAYDSTHDWWIAVFSSYPVSHFENRKKQIEEYDAAHATVTVKVYDSASGEYLTDTLVTCCDTDNITVSGNTKYYNKLITGKTDATGKLDLVLEIGKTYDFTRKGSGHITLTVTGDCEVILT